MPGDDQRASGQPAPEPFYEPIGGGWINEPREDDADRLPRRGSTGGAVLRQVVADWLGAISTVSFWAVTVSVLLVTWLVAVAVIAVLTAQEDPFPAGSQLWTYILASALMPSAASLLAVYWGLRPRPQPIPGRTGRTPLTAFFATLARGLVFAALALVVLLVQAGIAGAPGSIAAAAAGVIVLEFAVFGAIAAGISAWVRRPRISGVAGWALACWLVFGNMAAVWALLPAVRTEEPVAVVLNIEWGPGRIPLAYECSAEITRQAEVFHTERIMWLAAPNPLVIFTMLAAGADPGAGFPGWISAALQEAANGGLVPCVDSEPRTKDSVQTPLAAMGVAMQAVLAGGLLVAGHYAARRRVIAGE